MVLFVAVLAAGASAAPAPRIGLSSAVQSPFRVRSDWPQFKRSARHEGFNPFETVLSPQTVPQLQLSWRRSTGGTNYGYESPAVADGRVAMGGTDGFLYVFSTSTHKLLWKGRAAGPIWWSPAIANGLVYVKTTQTVQAFTVAGCGAGVCAPRWSVTVPPDQDYLHGTPVVAGGVVYVGTRQGVYAIGPGHDPPASPRVLWHGNSGDTVASPLVYRGDVYAESAGGGTIFRFPVGCRSDGGLCPASAQERIGSDILLGTPAAADGVLYVPTTPLEGHIGSLVALDATDLSWQWSIAIDGLTSVQSPVIADGVVYIGGGPLVAVSAATHTILWRSTVSGFDNAASVANGVVYAEAAQTTVYAWPTACSDPCAPIWSYPVGNEGSTPVVSDGVLYAATADGLAAFMLPS